MHPRPLLFTLLLAPTTAWASGPPEPIVLAARAGVWSGQYTAPSAGGLIELRLLETVGVELFSDHALTQDTGAWRHDHVIGFGLFAPTLASGPGWFVSPVFGACVDFRFTHPPEGRGPTSIVDVLFAPHGGLLAEFALGRGWSLRASAEGYAYLGHETRSPAWGGALSNGLSVQPVVLTTMGLGYQL